jgi:hypothetical protein
MRQYAREKKREREREREGEAREVKIGRNEFARGVRIMR